MFNKLKNKIMGNRWKKQFGDVYVDRNSNKKNKCKNTFGMVQT